MRIVELKDLTPGMVVARKVMSETGLVLLESGGRLTPSQIANLENWGVFRLYIAEKGEHRAVEAGGSSLRKTEFLTEYVETIGIIIKTFQQIRCFEELPVMQMRELVEQKIVLLSETIGAFDYLFEIRLHSEYTFQHSLNVAIIAGILGKWHNYKGAELKNLILAGLLHDVGKAVIPLEVLDKPDKLSDGEFNVIKGHALAGYQLVEETAMLDSSVKLAILQHHERIDGSGYPSGLENEEIHDYAKLIAVADIYDAITTDRPYRPRLTPLDAMEAIAAQMYDKLETPICLTFLDKMRDHFSGNSVLLSNGQHAKIVVLNTGERFWTKPIVSVTGGELIDLEKEEKLSIVELIVGSEAGCG
ncbi:MAG: HD-GYP domain-containing protein [Negativicutes bacterium]|nr:HD-GYP domain-containing protein [Negativicutes bacterium]